ncbi:uncharacterized protein CDAR_377061 [Caerostris darwini]|uniref:Uncharacterized protein n=1 Tax=Caerostris darwini TaxID=1538125 RepID=A0AAV4PNM1_9ARAC|nr:uncharacterized protein CDAR_377061 [Caerostris darwini]
MQSWESKYTYKSDGPFVRPLVVDHPSLLGDGVLADATGNGEVADGDDDQRHHETEHEVDHDERFVVGVVVLPVDGAGCYAGLQAKPAIKLFEIQT